MTAPTSSPAPARTAADAAVLGRPLWYDLMTADAEAAIAFYTNVAGWTMTPFTTPEGTYQMWTNGAGPVGGVMAKPAADPAPPHWMAYFGTPDVDATHAEATKRGATTYVPPTDIPQVGRFAVLADPQGAAFALFAPGNPAGPEQDPAVGTVSWHELVTLDQAAAFDFYSAVLGWVKRDVMDMGPMGPYQMFGRDRFTYGGMMNKPADMPAPPHWLLYIQVADLDAALERVRAGGGQVLNGPMEVPGGDRVAQCLDPQGAAFALHTKGSAPGT